MHGTEDDRGTAGAGEPAAPELPFPAAADAAERAAQAARLAAILAGYRPWLAILPLLAQADDAFEAQLHAVVAYARGWFAAGEAPPDALAFLADYDALFPDGPPPA